MLTLTNEWPKWLPESRTSKKLRAAKEGLKNAEAQSHEKFTGEETTVRIKRVADKIKRFNPCAPRPQKGG